MSLQINHRIRHGGQFRRLGHEELLPVAAQPQHLPLHRHEHALALGVQRPIRLVREQRSVAPPGVLGEVERYRPDQAFVDPLCREPGYAESGTASQEWRSGPPI